MNNFFVLFEDGCDDILQMKRFLEDHGKCHQILDNLYYFSTENNMTVVELRDTLMVYDKESRLFVARITGELNAAWHLSVENSDWLKENL